jgi:RNA polymerase sigma-70 factor, ECF subfamily
VNKNIEEKTAKELTDNELVEIVRGKDQERYAEVMERYQTKLFVYIYRLIGNKEEAEDLLQDVFVKAFKNLNSYDTKRKFSSWVYRIAHNEAVNFIKRKSLKRFISWETITSTKDKLDSSSEEEGADKAWLRKEVSREVSDAINKLPFKYRQVLTLRYYSDQSYEEIAEILGKPVNTVGTLINRAKKKLADEIKSNEALMHK